MEQQEMDLELKQDDQDRYDVAESTRRRLLNQYLRYSKMEKILKNKEFYRRQKELLIKQMTGTGR